MKKGPSRSEEQGARGARAPQRNGPVPHITHIQGHQKKDNDRPRDKTPGEPAQSRQRLAALERREAEGAGIEDARSLQVQDFAAENGGHRAAPAGGT